MEQTRLYEFEGLSIRIPLEFDPVSGMYLEIYPDFVEKPLWTRTGHPVMFAGEDACGHAEEAQPGGCPDCGSCKFYRPAAVHTWFGTCHHRARHRDSLDDPHANRTQQQ